MVKTEYLLSVLIKENSHEISGRIVSKCIDYDVPVRFSPVVATVAVFISLDSDEDFQAYKSQLERELVVIL